MSQDGFTDPVYGDYVQPADLVDHLCLFYPSEHRQGVQTQFGEKDAVITDIVDLTDGASYRSTMILQGQLIAVLKRNIGSGDAVLAVVGKGEAKKGQAAPYILTPATDDQKDVARKYIASNKRPVIQKDEFSV
jgi:hypothetical protein